jgi:hypothetical protein
MGATWMRTRTRFMSCRSRWRRIVCKSESPLTCVSGPAIMLALLICSSRVLELTASTTALNMRALGVGGRACRRCGFLLLCCALHYQCEGNLLASRKFHAGGKGPVVLVIFGDSRGATVVGLNQAERPGMPGTCRLLTERHQVRKFEDGIGVGIRCCGNQQQEVTIGRGAEVIAVTGDQFVTGCKSRQKSSVLDSHCRLSENAGRPPTSDSASCG